MEKRLIPNLNTLADVIDRLIVEVHKLGYFENKKREEHAKENPDVEAIARWDNLSRDCCEYRSLLKNEINKLFAEVVRTGEYKTLEEIRTFRAPRKPVSEILDEMCFQAALKRDLIEAIAEQLDETHSDN